MKKTELDLFHVDFPSILNPPRIFKGVACLDDKNKRSRFVIRVNAPFRSTTIRSRFVIRVNAPFRSTTMFFFHDVVSATICQRIDLLWRKYLDLHAQEVRDLTWYYWHEVGWARIVL